MPPVLERSGFKPRMPTPPENEQSRMLIVRQPSIASRDVVLTAYPSIYHVKARLIRDHILSRRGMYIIDLKAEHHGTLQTYSVTRTLLRNCMSRHSTLLRAIYMNKLRLIWNPLLRGKPNIEHVLQAHYCAIN